MRIFLPECGNFGIFKINFQGIVNLNGEGTHFPRVKWTPLTITETYFLHLQNECFSEKGLITLSRKFLMYTRRILDVYFETLTDAKFMSKFR